MLRLLCLAVPLERFPEVQFMLIFQSILEVNFVMFNNLQSLWRLNERGYF
jgi:hypothetical protein